MSFILSSDESELLLLLKSQKTVQSLARVLRKDVSVVSRQLKALSQKEEVLQKIDARWKLTPLGERFADWAQESIQAQKTLTKNRTKIRVATTREFASRILAPQIQNLFDLKKTEPEIISDDQRGIESLLLSGKADFGFDCGTPYDPSIAFKTVIAEDLGIVWSPKFSKSKASDVASEFPTEYIHNERNDLSLIFKISKSVTPPKVTASDIATVRAMLVQGLGFSLLPYYTVKDEIKRGELIFAKHKLIEELKYGVWWPRSRTN